MKYEQIAVACHENEVPPHIEGKLEQLYGSMYASFAQFRVYGGLEGASTYIARQDDEIKDIFLFRRQGRAIHVVNEQIRVDEQAVNLFAQTIFARYPAIDIISFHAVDADPWKLPFPAQRFNCTNDISMPLPPTVQEYYARLGKSTRKTLNQNINRIQRRFPSFQFQVLLNEQADEQQLLQVIAFNRARMAGKSRTSAIDDDEAERIIRFTRRCGLVGLIMIDGRICAGAICYRIGDSYTLRVIAHDPAYNAYGLGMLCCYRTICECIARGGKEYRFMWGQEEYKYRLLGVERELAHVVIYRSGLHMMRHPGTVVRTAINGYTTQTRMWILEKIRQKESPAGRAINSCASFLRNCKRLVNEVSAGRKPAILQLSEKK